MRVGFLFAVSFFLFLKSSYLFVVQIDMVFKLFAILQMYEFSSKSQRFPLNSPDGSVVCDTANVRVFKQITTQRNDQAAGVVLFAILQMYEFSSKSQRKSLIVAMPNVVCDTANVRVFKQITTGVVGHCW